MGSDSAFTYACRASTGTRSHQEDCSEIWRPEGSTGKCHPLLAVIADGMGGHVSGEVASKLTCQHYVQTFSTSEGSIAQRLERSLLASNEALNSAIRHDGALKGMGCTFVAMFVDSDGLRWVSVGDSALLLYRNGTLRRLNADHSLGAMLNRQVEAGLITPDLAKNDPRRRALRSALTGGDIPLKDYEFNPYPLEEDDRIILATDGLEVLSGNEIASIIKEHEQLSAEAIAASLMEAVEKKQSESQDNTTFIVLHVGRQNTDQLLAPADSAATVIVDQRANELSSDGKRRRWFPRLLPLLVFLLLAIAFFALETHETRADKGTQVSALAER